MASLGERIGRLFGRKPRAKPQLALSPMPAVPAMADDQRSLVPSTEISATPSRVTIARPLRNVDTYNMHPATGLTAEMLIAYFRTAERGTPIFQFDAFDDLIERDGHLRGLIDGRIQAVAGKDWVILPGREGDAASTAAALELELALKNDLGFRDFLEHQLTAPFYGFAATNLVWDFVDGHLVPVSFINVAHRRFASPSFERANEIMLVAGDSKDDLLPLQPGLWAVSRFRHRNPWAAGLMRTAAWWSMFKSWAIRDWQVFADMFGLPLAVGYYETGASEPARNALIDAVKNIGTDGYAVLSEETTIVIKDAVRSGDATSLYPAIAAFAEAQESKLITGGTANTDIGNKGSYAAGDIHADRSYSLTLSDARRVEEMFVRDIGRPFVKWNGYGKASPPRLKMQITREQSLLERAQVLAILGTAIDLDQEQIREEFSLRTPAAGAGVKFPSKATPPPAPGGNE